jgi:ABC-type oligopeptide transport system ATPase subunit
MTIIKCEDVRKYFTGRTGTVKAVDGIFLEIYKGDTFGIVGESGCGKTTLGKMILGILKPDSGRITLGTGKIQVIFQDPYNSLDPKMRIFDVLAEGIVIQRQRDKDTGIQRYRETERRVEIKRRVEEVLDLVRLPKEALKKYPHQFSGGERQRIAIGRAVLTNPEFIVCDEPVSSLDVTIQLDILKLLKDIQKTFSITYLFISHDLKIVKFMCNKLAVMRFGRIIECGAAKDIYAHPSEEYTKSLLSSVFYDTMKS